MQSLGQTVIASAQRSAVRVALFAAFVSLFLSVLQLLVPLYMLQLYDRVLNSRSLDTLIALTVITIAGLAVYAVLDFIRSKAFLVLGEKISHRLSVPVLQAAVAESLQKPSANHAQALRDVGELRLLVTSSAFGMPFDALWAPFFFIVLFLLHPAYGAVALAGGAVLIGLGVVVELVSRRPLARASDANNRIFAMIGSAMRNAEVIEAMGLLAPLAARWRRLQQQALALMNQGSSTSRAAASASKALRLGVQVCMLATGVYLVLDHQASPGSVIAASIIMARALLPFEQLIDGWRQWVFAIAAYDRIRTLLGAGESARQTLPLPVHEGRLVADRVVFVPPGGDRPVLKGVSFVVEPGEVLGIVGPSGAGKSTLARLLMGIWAPTSGGVYLDGQNVFLWERDSFGQNVGYLPQNVALLDGTVRDNIARFTDADPKDVVEAARQADVHELIGRLPNGYDTEVRDTGFNLSGGQRQRLALARALFGKPRLLVLDEPNSNLDNAGERALIRAIESARRAGTAVVLIAHRPSIIAAVDKILVLKDGLVEQFGPRTEIIRTIVPGGVLTPAAVTAQEGRSA